MARITGYKCINKTVLSITYKTYNGETETYDLHPYLLRLFNGRWFTFGYRPDKNDNYWCVPLDRIENVEPKNDCIINSRPEKYTSYFDDIIGVTKGRLTQEDNIEKAFDAELITICVNDFNTWKRTITKPVHKSQKIIKQYEDGGGMIELKVIPNREFYYRLLSLGPGVSILKPTSISNIMCSIIESLRKGYECVKEKSDVL